MWGERILDERLSVIYDFFGLRDCLNLLLLRKGVEKWLQILKFWQNKRILGEICLSLPDHIPWDFRDNSVPMNRSMVDLCPYVIAKSSYYFCKGIRHYEEKDFAKCISALDICQELMPESDIIRCRKGDALYAMKRTDETLQAYDSALKINSECSYAYNGIALLHDRIAELDCREEIKQLVRDNTTISLYIKALSLDRRNSYAAVNLAMNLQSGAVSSADLEEIRALVHVVKQEQPARGYGGEASAGLDRVANFAVYLTVSGLDNTTSAHLSIQLLIISLKINPKLFYARRCLAELLFEAGLVGKALAAYNDDVQASDH